MKNDTFKTEYNNFLIPENVNPLVLNIIDNNVISISGAVVNPGLYPLGDMSN